MTFAIGKTGAPRPLARWGGLALVLSVLGLAGCKDVLDVENPNELEETDLGKPVAAPSIVNGASATLARALGGMLGIYSVVTDEATWIGSRDAWKELDLGELSNPRNEFTDDAFRYISEARWMTDEAVRRLEAFDADKSLTDRNQLARAYIFASIARITIADMFDDFALSDRREAAKPIGPANMVKLYDDAVANLDKALTIARATNSAELERQALGLRSRAKFSKAVWNKLNPKGRIPTDPLVNDAGANQDAAMALAVMPADYRFILTLTNDDIAYAGEVSLAYLLNQRLELDVGPAFGKLGKTPTVNLKDPVTNQADPRVAAMLTELRAAYVNQPITIVSAREMRLILAEAALAQRNMDEFAKQINAIRALGNLPPWTGQVPALDILKHERRVNLFVQGRRLADLYRFGERAPEWQTNPAPAVVKTPGTFFPITCIEIRSHPEDFPNVSC